MTFVGTKLAQSMYVRTCALAEMWTRISCLVLIRLAIIKCKNIFIKMLNDVGIEVPKSIETRSKFSMHADKAGDDSMQQS